MEKMQHVSDIRSNKNDQVAYAATELMRSERKRKVFEAVYAGKRAIKTVASISSRTKLPRQAVLDVGKMLSNAKLIHQTKHKGETAYTKDSDIKGLWKKILGMNKAKLDKLPTKVNPKGTTKGPIIIKLAGVKPKFQQITIDDLSSFSRIKSVSSIQSQTKISESKFKVGILRILKEQAKPPKDWGGEANDIFTTRLKIGQNRFHAAFALKGPGKKNKKLMPGDMGKNGDQIQRLLRSSAQVFFVQYWREIDQSVIDQMHQLAIAKSVAEGRRIYYGIIDGNDSSRLIRAYPNQFK